nr:hypothetical protein CFP56_21488 [Quercus suber]
MQFYNQSCTLEKLVQLVDQCISQSNFGSGQWYYQCGIGYGSFKHDELGVQSPFSSALELQGSDLRADPHASYQKEFLQVSHIESTSF